MYNHLRTLLLNRDGRQTSLYGEELVPESYRQVPLSTALNAIDSVLFGARADRSGRNYRLQQLLTLIHNSDLAGHVTVKDPRITYALPFQGALSLPAFPSLIRGNAEMIRLYGTPPESTESGGRMEFEWEFLIVDDSPMRIQVLNRQFTLTFNEAWSEPLDVPESKLRVRFHESAALNDAWLYQYLAPPETDLSVAATALRTLGDSVHLSLFGAESVEPYASFRAASESTQIARCLSGFALALAYRVEERLHA